MKALTGSLLAVALCAVLGGCAEQAVSSDGGEAVAAPVPEDELLAEYAKLVGRMSVIEWRGQAFRRPPAQGGKVPVVEVSGRWFRDSGDSDLTMTSRDGRREETVDYLVRGDRLYFNSDAWGFVAQDCWADITGDQARSWALPHQLDPTWVVDSVRPVRRQGEGVRGAVRHDVLLDGLPRGFHPTTPEGATTREAMGDAEAYVEMTRHGDLLVLGIDVADMWNEVDEQHRDAFDPRGAWWAMSLEDAGAVSSQGAPEHVFDPETTAPSSCRRG